MLARGVPSKGQYRLASGIRRMRTPFSESFAADPTGAQCRDHWGQAACRKCLGENLDRSFRPAAGVRRILLVDDEHLHRMRLAVRSRDGVSRCLDRRYGRRSS